MLQNDPLARKRVAQEERLSRSLHHDLVTPDAKTLPIFLSGGVGDVIMGIETIKELLRLIPRCEVYTHHPDTYTYFKPSWYPEALEGPFIPNYTYWLEVNSVARLRTQEGFAGFNSPEIKTLYAHQQELFHADRRLKTLVLEHASFDNVLARWAVSQGHNRRSLPLWLLGLGRQQEIVPKRKKPALKQITVHDGVEVTIHTRGVERSTKQWDLGYWESLVGILRVFYPDHEVIQLGSKRSRPIAGVTQMLAGKLSLPESFDVLAGSVLHIDGDSGLVHAAHALGVKSTVLFGPTPMDFYGYPNNVNLRAGACHNCYWIDGPGWLKACPLGHSTPRCMDALTPMLVFACVQKQLAQL